MDDNAIAKYPKITKPWKPVGTSSIETHDGEMLVTIHNGNFVNPWTLQMICDGVNFLARSWLPEIGGKESMASSPVDIRVLRVAGQHYGESDAPGMAQLLTGCADEIERLRAALLFLGKAFELEDDQTDSGFTYREALGHSAGDRREPDEM